MLPRANANHSLHSNRRDFLKTGSALAAAGAIAGELSLAHRVVAAPAAQAEVKPEIPGQLIGCPAGYPQDLPPAEVKRRFRKILGDFQRPSVPLNSQVTEEVELPGGIVRQRIEYDVAPGERVPAYHLFRRGLPADAPGVLSIHEHGGIFAEGKAFHCHPKADDSIQYSYRAALAGFRVLAPDALCFGERRISRGYSRDFMEEVLAHAELCSRGLSLAWKSVWDNSRALEMLEQLGAHRLGVIGLSGGSTQSYIVAAANEKVRAAVCYSSFVTLRQQFYQYRLCHCLYHYIPGMVAAGIDWDQVVATIAPRKLFMQIGGLEIDGALFQAFVTAIQRRCELEHLPPSLTAVVRANMGHDVGEPGLKAGFEFLKEHLQQA